MLLLLFSGAKRLSVGGNGFIAQTSGSSFSRKRFKKIRDELLAAEEARQELLNAAYASKDAQRRYVMEEAAGAAERAIEEAREDSAKVQVAQLAKLTRLIESASEAVGLAQAFQASDNLITYAVALAEKLEDDDDEEAIAMLLS